MLLTWVKNDFGCIASVMSDCEPYENITVSLQFRHLSLFILVKPCT